MEEQIIGLKELKGKIAYYSRRVQQGRSFIVVKQSKPLFKISRPIFEEEDFEANGTWETVVDFTNGGKKTGMKLRSFIKELEHERSRKVARKSK